MIKIPDHLKDKNLEFVVLHNSIDSDFNILGNEWGILLGTEEFFNGEKTREDNEAGKFNPEKPLFVRIYSFQEDRKKYHAAAMHAVSWLYLNKVAFRKLRFSGI